MLESARWACQLSVCVGNNLKNPRFFACNDWAFFGENDSTRRRGAIAVCLSEAFLGPEIHCLSFPRALGYRRGRLVETRSHAMLPPPHRCIIRRLGLTASSKLPFLQPSNDQMSFVQPGGAQR